MGFWVFSVRQEVNLCVRFMMVSNCHYKLCMIVTSVLHSAAWLQSLRAIWRANGCATRFSLLNYVKFFNLQLTVITPTAFSLCKITARTANGQSQPIQFTAGIAYVRDFIYRNEWQACLRRDWNCLGRSGMSIWNRDQAFRGRALSRMIESDDETSLLYLTPTQLKVRQIWQH